ncbi:MAG: glycosyltransferase family 2 protein [Verrucomicrobiia bacterium]|jgi:dolichol-phosphate mannosyltransferase
MSSRPLISIVSPVLNEEQAIAIFYQRLRVALAPLRDQYDFELLFTNNCSTDGTLETVLKLREHDPSVQILTFSRNFGYEASVATGLRYACGDAIVQIDVDCEDPPELIPDFVREWQNGYDVVYGKRDRRREFAGMHWARKAFYRLNYFLADSETILDMGNFYLISAAVRDAVTANRSTLPFVRSEVAYAGFRRKGISYERQRRTVGKTHFSLGRVIRFALAAILSSSTFPLRLSLYMFPLLAISNVILLAIDRFQWMVALDFLWLVFSTAMISLYLARTYKDIVQRPVVVVDSRRSAWNQLRNPPDASPTAGH